MDDVEAPITNRYFYTMLSITSEVNLFLDVLT
jgi:hypothetical protein